MSKLANQEVVDYIYDTLKQEIDDNKTEILNKSVTTESGANNLRYYNDKLAVKQSNNTWKEIKTGGSSGSITYDSTTEEITISSNNISYNAEDESLTISFV